MSPLYLVKCRSIFVYSFNTNIITKCFSQALINRVINHFSKDCAFYRSALHCVPKKLSHLMFDNNFGLMWTDFRNHFTRWFARKFCMHTTQRFPPDLQYVATLPCESQKSKNVTDFDSTWTDCWHVPNHTLKTWFNIEQY